MNPAAALPLSGLCAMGQGLDRGQIRSRSSAESLHARCRRSWPSASAQGGVSNCSCYCHPAGQASQPTNQTADQGDDVPMTPKTTENQISKGAAPRAAARQKAHVQKSADKLDALKAQQAETGNAVASALAGDPAPLEEIAASAPAPPPAESREPTVQFVVDGKPVGVTQNRLSSISRVTATKTEARWPAEQFRAWLAEQGVADPNHTTWEVTLPNGRKIAAVAKTSARKAKRGAAKKAAPAAETAEVAKAS